MKNKKVFLLTLFAFSLCLSLWALQARPQSAEAATTPRYTIAGIQTKTTQSYIFFFKSGSPSITTTEMSLDAVKIFGSAYSSNTSMAGAIFLNDTTVKLDFTAQTSFNYHADFYFKNKTTGETLYSASTVYTLNPVFGTASNIHFNKGVVSLSLAQGVYYVQITGSSSSMTAGTGSTIDYDFKSYDIVVDTTAPSVSTAGFTDGGFTNGVPNIWWNRSQTGAGGAGYSHSSDTIKGYYTKSLNTSIPSSASTEFTWDTYFRDEGHYRAYVTDKAGNSVEYTFTVDKTAPTGTLSGVTNGGFTNGSVSFSWSAGVGGIGYQRTRNEDTLTVTYGYSTNTSIPTSRPNTVTDNQTFTDAGHYSIRIQDSAGNYTDYTFTIDKTAPTGTLSGVTNGGFTNGNVSFSWTTTTTGMTSQLTRSTDAIAAYYSYATGTDFPSGATTSYTSGTALSTAGHYRIRIQDSAGNYTDYTFTIDKTAPTGTLSGVTNGGFTNGSVSFSWGTGVSGITYQRTRTADSLSVSYGVSTGTTIPTSVTDNVTNGQTFSAAGHYRIRIQDSAGNYTDYTFTIDKTAPTGTLSGVTNGGFTKTGVQFTWATTLSSITSQRTRAEDTLKIQYRRDLTGQRSFSGAWSDFNTILEVEGDYQLQISDAAGNSTTYTFTIDKTKPSATLRTSDSTSLSGDGRTKANYVYFTWSTGNSGAGSAGLCSIGDTLTAQYKIGNSAWQSYVQSTQLTQEGNYIFQIFDTAGNISEYTFTIDRTVPVFNIINRSQQQLSILNPFYNQDVRVIWTSQKYTTTLNGVLYDNSPLIDSDKYLTAEGAYNLVITDDIGNRATLTITIIKHIPASNFNRLKTIKNKWYETINNSGSTVSFSNYEDCYAFSLSREQATLTYGQWKTATWDGGIPIAPADINIAVQYANYIVYKSFDNPNVLHAYFSVATLNDAIEHYISANLKEKYIPAEPATAAVGQDLYREIYYSKGPITFNTIANTQLYIDNVPFAYPYTLTVPGTHTIREQDFAGNYIIYSVVIDVAPPMLRVCDLTNNNSEVLIYGGSVYKTYGLKLWLDDIDPDALLIITDSSKTTVYMGKTVELRSAGIYNISVRDAAGNIGSLTLYISLTVPTIAISDNTVNDLTVSFNVQISKNGNLNNFSNISIQKNIEGVWTAITYDNAALPALIGPSNLTYLFDTSGTYRIILVDVFGRWIEQEYTFVKAAPKGIIQASNGTMLNSGDATRYNVSFTWSAALSCTATLNGQPYVKNTSITAEGTHTIILTNNENVSNTYIFTIDKTAPKGKIFYKNGAQSYELDNNKTVKYDIYFTWSENDCYALLNGEQYTNSSLITNDGYYTLRLYDKAGNMSEYAFTIKKSLPTGKIYTISTTLKNGDLTNKDVYFTWSESNCSALINGVSYLKDSKISVEGTYTILLTDAYGNTNAYYFTIDKTPATGTLKMSNGEELLSGSSTRFDVYLTWTEPDATAIINSKAEYIKDAVITMEGTYTIVLSDAAGNKTTFQFTIKKTPPKGTLKSNGEEFYTGHVTRYDVTFTWTESGCSALLDGHSYSKNDRISTEGSHIIKLTDSVGNSVEYIFIIDKTPPLCKILSNGEELQNNTVTRFDALFVWEEENCTALLNGKEYILGTELKEEGEYRLTLYDAVGNSAVYIVIINRTPKTGTIISNYAILQSGSLTKYNTYFTWNDAKSYATLNGSSYDKGTIISADGTYHIILTDSVGNVSEYSFTIDKTPPELFAYMIINDYNYLLADGALTNNSVYFSWHEEGVTALLNGIPYEKETLITTDGVFSLELVDAAGNRTSITITIDKTAPTGKLFNMSGTLLDKSITKESVYFTWSESNVTVVLNGETYSKNNIISANGYYELIITDRAGNSTKYVFTIDKELPKAEIYNLSDAMTSGPYFTDGFYITWEKSNCFANLNGVEYEKGALITAEGDYIFSLVSEVGNEFIINLVIDRTAPEGTLFLETGEAIENGTSTRQYVKFTWSEDGCIATLNGEKYSKNSEIFRDGNYTIILSDAAGNTSVFTFIIHRALPTGVIISVTKEKELYDGASTTGIVAFVSFDEDCIILLDGEEYLSGTEISTIGKHTIVIRNYVGGEKTYNFTIREENEKTNIGLAGIFNGSTTGSVLFIIAISLTVFTFLLFPVLRTRVFKKNPLKAKLKKGL